MKDILNKQGLFYISIALLVACSHLFLSYLPKISDLSNAGIYATAIILLISLLFGSRFGLMSTLITLFIIGSLYFWALLVQPVERKIVFSEMDLFIFGSGLVILSLVSGYIHDYASHLLAELNKKKQEVKALVSIDPETGFDNRDRMLLEVEAEMNRIRRYGGLFTIVLYKIDYLQEFQDLYGKNEYSRLIETFLNDFQNATRTTDKKFRTEYDVFGLLLPYTPEQNMDIIYGRLTDLLQDYETEKGKVVSFTSHVAHISVEGNEEKRAEELLAILRNELKTNAL